MSDPYIGEIRMFGGNFAPAGWAFCDGSILSIADYETLYEVIGTTYGGDGQETFGLPNLSSRIPFGAGVGAGLNLSVGQSGGAESVVLTAGQLPAHTHPAQASGYAATSTTPAGNVWAVSGDSPYTTDAPDVAMDPAGTSTFGGSLEHENRPPFVAMSFIICLAGNYPSQG